ncbi:DUF99 family protein [Halostella sp. JP-L12]|uniref:endonuclease dU n=1 Tax=Halostella TaxID=1843185 RepID=UPI000EF7D8C0|nr:MULTISPECIES: DUF99 family protein [Halostella]NHN46778.1 DUF99 family protein [Halostella sp. JP-L12]
MKPGTRALGIAESFRSETSTLAGAVTRASRVVDGFAFSTCTVGGDDATDAIVELYERLDREDVRYVMVAGVAPAWYNLVDLRAVRDAVDRPVVAVTFEESSGLEASLREEFDGEALQWRLDAYDALPPRHPVDAGDDTVFVRSVGIDDDEADEVVRAFTPEGGRPEPVRVARLAARACDETRRE